MKNLFFLLLTLSSIANAGYYSLGGGLPPAVNGDCLVGSGGAWAAGSCSGSGGITSINSDTTAAQTIAGTNGLNCSTSSGATTCDASSLLLASSFSDTGVTGKLITGYSSGAGTVAGTD